MTEIYGFNVFAYDDMQSKQAREYLRERMDSYVNSNNQPSQQYTNSLLSKINSTNSSTPVFNFAKVDEAQNTYRGALEHLNKEKIERLRNFGIGQIIELREKPYYKALCSDLGMDYLWFNMTDVNFSHPVFISKEKYCQEKMQIFNYFSNWTKEDWEKTKKLYEEQWQKIKDDFIEDFSHFTRAINKGNALVGCCLGTYTTDSALLLNYFFNPNAKNSNVPKTNPRNGKYYLQLFHNLSEENKVSLGWDKNFEKNFCSRLEDFGLILD